MSNLCDIHRYYRHIVIFYIHISMGFGRTLEKRNTACMPCSIISIFVAESGREGEKNVCDKGKYSYSTPMS